MYKMLVADDAVDELNVLVYLIHRFQMPFEIYTAHDGAEALQVLESVSPDVIITDIQMPLADGLQIAARAKELLPDSVTAIISAHDDFSYARSAIRLGVEDYLLKPINPTDIKTVLNKILSLLDSRRKSTNLTEMGAAFIRRQLLHQLTADSVDKLPETSMKLAREYLGCYNTICIFNAMYGYFEHYLEEFSTFIQGMINEPFFLSISDTSELLLFDRNDLKINCSADEISLSAVHLIQEHCKNVHAAIGTVDSIAEIYGCFGELNELLENCYKFPEHAILHREWIHDLSNFDFNGSSHSATAAFMHSRIRTLKEYIADHYGESLSLEKLASIIYVHPDYLSRIFKKETGQNLNQYIRTYRMEKAKELLLSSSQKVAEIGCTVGYSNNSYFSKSFSDYTGVTPEKYRELGGLNRVSI